MMPSAPPSAPPVAPIVPAGWHPDPWQPGQLRWWDGAAWTPHITPGWGGPSAGYAPYQPTSASGWFPDISTLRFPAAGFGVLLTAILLAGNFAITATKHDDVATALISLGALGFYAIGLPLGAWFASRRWGSGHWVRDLGLRFKPIDAALGLAGAVAMLITVVVVGLLVHAFGVPQRSNLSDVHRSNKSWALFIFLVVQAGLLAPFTEELLFRGVIFRGLTDKLRIPAALVVQAVIFGAAHTSLDGGWGNVGLAVTLACVGAELAFLARSTGRLGAGMVAHGLFNTAQICLLFFVTLR